MDLTNEDLERLRAFDSCTIANAIETFNVRPRNAGYMLPSVSCVFPAFGVMVGYAVTARVRANAPASKSYPREDWWKTVASSPGPRIAVIQDMDEPPVGAFWGEVQSNIHKALGCVGAVTNGGVRDLSEVEPIGFHYFAGSVMVSRAYVDMIDFGTPVTVAGLEVKTGDLLHADRHGVQVIPIEIARDIPAACEKIIAQERVLVTLCQSPDFSIEALKASLS